MSADLHFENLYRRHGPGVFRRALQFFGREADAQEVVQDVFLSLYENPGQFQGRASLSTFLYRMTTNACLSRLRNESNRDRLRRENLPNTTENTPDGELGPELRLLLLRTLRAMPNDLALTAVLYIMDGLNQREVARVLGCSHRHVGNLLQRVEQWGSRLEATA